MRAGVTMRDPSTVYVDWDVTIAHRRHPRPGSGPARDHDDRRGERHRAGHDDRRLDHRPRAAGQPSVVEGSIVEDGARIGPYSHLRPGAHIGPGAEVGNYAEVKNIRLGARVKQHHMSYLGDAEIGAGTNVGAGTITANWDGTPRTGRASARTHSSASTRCSSPRSRSARGRRPARAPSSRRTCRPGKLAVGVPARMREPRRSRTPPNQGGRAT